MQTYTPEQLTEILEQHKIWLKDQTKGKRANLQWANLQGANLQWANLQGANLWRANLQRADLQWSDLQWANLQWANLQQANLQGANLQGANLQGADLQGCKQKELVLAKTIIVPDGDIIGWKKCKNGVICKLLIPKDSKRSNALGRKCRAEYVKVLELFNGNEALSLRDGKTKYEVDKLVYCDKYDENRLNECSGGIHFFITREEAEEFEL